eukprot:gene36212-47097_t
MTDVNAVVYPTSLNYTLNLTVETIIYDSSRNFAKCIFATNFATKTSATKILSTQIYIENNDGAILNKSKKGKTVLSTTAPTSMSSVSSKSRLTPAPTMSPSKAVHAPSISPIKSVSVKPTSFNSKKVNAVSTISPTKSSVPTRSPTKVVSAVPTRSPTKVVSAVPTRSPTKVVSAVPNRSPTKVVSAVPTRSPTKVVSSAPTRSPTKVVSSVPTISPTKVVSAVPTRSPTKIVSAVPTRSPTKVVSSVPTISPTKAVGAPSITPSSCSTNAVKIPSAASSAPVKNQSPPKATSVPTNILLPSARPLVLSKTAAPTLRPSAMPSAKPSAKSSSPSRVPSNKPSATPSLAPDSLKYNPGKKIMTGTVNLYNIYFGYFPPYPQLDSSQQTMNLINYFSANIGNSSWYKTVTTYYQVNDDGSKTYASASVVLKKSVTVQASVKRRNVVDRDVIDAIVSRINLGLLPVDENGIYNVIFRGEFKYSGWLSQWCGFHSVFATTDGRLLKYTVQGDPSTAATDSQIYCEGSSVFPTANGNTGADSLVNILAHDIAETVTDYDDAWNEGSTAFEIGDRCGWDFFLGNNSDTRNWN